MGERQQSRAGILAVAILLVGGPTACQLGPDDTFDDGLATGRAALAEDGRWMVPASTLLIGDEQDVEFTGAGPWLGEESCSGGMQPGSEVLRDYLASVYPQIRTIGGYACRPIVGDPAHASVHSTGRALDVMIPLTSDGAADNDLGDPIGRWLIEHAEEIGIQQLIWDRTVWRAERTPGAKATAYTGESPHADHLHVELSVEAAAMGTRWFSEEHAAPEVAGCPSIPLAGAVVDDDSDCLTMYGPTRSWRAVDDAGEGGSLLWTNAFEGDAPSNWARWALPVAVAGDYRVEVSAPAGYGVYQAARYEVVHGGSVDEVVVDQAAGGTWKSLGVFHFAATTGEHVDVFDNSSEAVADDQHIAVDAVRLVPIGDDVAGGSASGDDGSALVGGCSAGGGGAGAGASMLALAWLIAQRRRARRRLTS